MPYLNLDPDFFSHPKTVRLCGLLGHEAAIYPLRLWSYCAKFHPVDANLSSYSREEIEGVMGWRGEVGKLVETLVHLGMLEAYNGHFSIHDWKEHQGHLEAFKVRGRLAAQARWAKLREKKPKNATSNATGMLQAMPQPTNQPTNRIKNKHPFEKSEFFPFENFQASLSDWSQEKCRHWFDQAVTYSGANGGRYLDWRLAVKGWDRKTPYKEKLNRPHIPRF